MKYECDQCGACCQGTLIVEAERIDVVREPRLKDADSHYAGESLDAVLEALADEMRAVTLACGSRCPFLADDNRCSIYPTRPNDCVAMQAGDEQCQQARSQAGLDPLQPTGAEREQPVAEDEALQAQYRAAYLEQLRRQQCPGCGEEDLF